MKQLSLIRQTKKCERASVCSQQAPKEIKFDVLVACLTETWLDDVTCNTLCSRDNDTNMDNIGNGRR